ncbi:hypothetical protein GCM10011349_41880 [Novosphingobium indicum]|uniref:TraD/TraG TraM recognition site domain-containing protein n=1 Tax=Novosphingobium indicum TaxID=462949 RepID=A0ABQ2JZM4_9SPHN|nr:type IV secretory system conjugative DNA transfer family protein [Novosphingobium indicum]GGN60391.1 hypothetical protein GCM10011349_41880 [Novosphingobium indicum]
MFKELTFVGQAVLLIGKFLLAMSRAVFVGIVFIVNRFRIPGKTRLPGFGGKTLVLCPGDPPEKTLGYQDAMDYRGTAKESELDALRAAGVPMGRFLHPKGQARASISLPLETLQRGCAVIGPTGAGKTEGIILPWITALLHQGASVVTCDVKGDLFDRLRSVAQAVGARIWYWNISDPARSMSWNWFDAINDYRDIEAATLSILGRPKPNDNQPFFYDRDFRWLRALINITKQAYKHTAQPRYLYSLVADQTALNTLFRQSPNIQHLATEVSDLLQFTTDEHSKAVSGLLNALHLFNTPPIRHVTERSDFRLEEISHAPTLLIVGAALADGRASEVMSGMFINQLNNHIYRRLGGTQATTLPLYLILDEAARLKDRVNYEELLSVVRSAKVGVCLASQDVNQFGNLQEQVAILSNCLSFIALRGSSPDTAKYLSSRLGQRQEEQIYANANRGPFDLLSTHGKSRHTTSVPVLAEREIMQPPGPPYAAVAHTASITKKPFLIDLTNAI